MLKILIDNQSRVPGLCSWAGRVLLVQNWQKRALICGLAWSLGGYALEREEKLTFVFIYCLASIERMILGVPPQNNQ